MKNLKDVKDEHVIFYQISNFVQTEKFSYWFLLISHLILLVTANHEFGYFPGGDGEEWGFVLDFTLSIKVMLSYFFFVNFAIIARKHVQHI